MNQLNSLILEGNITREPEFRETPHGFKVCKIPLAVNHYYKNSEGVGVDEVSYFNIEAYGKNAEYCQTRSEKGRGMRVVGRLKQERWKNAEGKNISCVTIIAEHIEFKPLLEKKINGRNELTDVAAATAAAANEYSRDSENQVAAEALF